MKTKLKIYNVVVMILTPDTNGDVSILTNGGDVYLSAAANNIPDYTVA
jgi:hypothetical protein